MLLKLRKPILKESCLLKHRNLPIRIKIHVSIDLCSEIYCPATRMQYGDKGFPSIILVGRGLLVKMLITLEPRGLF